MSIPDELKRRVSKALKSANRRVKFMSMSRPILNNPRLYAKYIDFKRTLNRLHDQMQDAMETDNVKRVNKLVKELNEISWGSGENFMFQA